METADLVAATVDRFPLERADGSPTSAGQWLLARHNAELYDGVLRTHISAGPGLDKLVEFLLRRQPERIDAVAPAIAHHPSGRLQSAACARILRATGARHAQPMLEAWHAMGRPNDPHTLTEKAQVGIELAAACPGQFGGPVRDFVMRLLTDMSLPLDEFRLVRLVPDVIRAGRPEYLDALLASLCDPHRGLFVAIAVATVGGPECAALLHAALEHPAPEARLKAAGRLKDLGVDTDRVVHAIQRELQSAAPHAGFVGMAAAWRTEDFAEALWKLLANKSNPVREAATRGLMRLGAASVPRAMQALTAKKNLEREAAVPILANADAPECRQASKTTPTWRRMTACVTGSCWRSTQATRAFRKTSCGTESSVP